MSETEDLSNGRSSKHIPVSARQNPVAYFNLSRKMLETSSEVVLSALEGAIVSAVDAAFLLERSKVATITKVHTDLAEVLPRMSHDGHESTSRQRRSRIQITVTRTLQYEEFIAAACLNEASTQLEESELLSLNTVDEYPTVDFNRPNESEDEDTTNENEPASSLEAGFHSLSI